MAGLGLVGVSLNQVGYTVGLSLTSGSNSALIFASAPVWGLLLGAVLGLERPAAGGVLGLALALGGVALVVGGRLGSGGASVGGDLLVCLSAFSWGAYAVLSMPVLRRLDPLVVGGWTMLLGGAAVLPLALRRLPRPLGAALLRGIGARWGRRVVGGRRSTRRCCAAAFAIAAWQVNVSRLGANRVLVYLYLVTLVGTDWQASWC